MRRQRAYVHATKDGWGADELKKLGLEPAVFGRRPRRPHALHLRPRRPALPWFSLSKRNPRVS
jgi:hypothetical protein